MCWVLAGQAIQSSMTIASLTKVEGIIDKTIEVGKRKYKSRRKTYELRVFLQDTSEYFRFMEIYKYKSFLGQIHRGDTTRIYIRPKWLIPLGMGYRNDIFQMTLNGKTIFDIYQTRKNSKGIIIVALIAIPGFILLGQYIRRKK